MQTDTIKAAIIEDQESSRTSLKYMLAALFPKIEIVCEAESVERAALLIEQSKPQLVFLDVELTDGNSFALLQRFHNPSFSIIFITAHDEYALKAIKFSALDYLLKPIDPSELTLAVEKFIHKKENLKEKKLDNLMHNLKNENIEHQKIALSSSTEIFFVSLNDIVKLEGEKNYTVFHLIGGKKITVCKTLREYEDMLEDFNFFRVHQSYIINMGRISKYLKGKGGYAVMDDGSKVEISVRRKDDFLRTFS